MKTPQSVNLLEGDSISATDGLAGKLKEFYFDDATWKIRYAVVEVGSWLSRREVLVGSQDLGRPDGIHSTQPVTLTKEQVENSPPADTDMPVAMQHEAEMMSRYEHGVFFSWGEGYIGTHNFDIPSYSETEIHRNSGGKEYDPHLRSTRYVRGSAVHASDGPIGHVRDFVVDDESWTIRSMVVEFGALFDSKKVLVPCEWVSGIVDDDAIIKMRVTKESIRNSPAVESHDLEREIGAGNASVRG
jgi:uncharacterized protein YrrD